MLSEELDALWKKRRREVVPALSAAAAEGDRSENAEYIYRKRQLGEIDRRIRYLSKRLEDVTVVDQPPERRDRIYFGASITVMDEAGVEHEYTIAGADEIDAARGYISIDSPLARALLGKEAGSEAVIRIDQHTNTYIVRKIRYP
jgi:transcription elongation factor GreB